MGNFNLHFVIYGGEANLILEETNLILDYVNIPRLRIFQMLKHSKTEWELSK